MDLRRVYFVTGIDTDAGKSVVTGVLARDWRAKGINVITQKFIQTGCTDSISEDILTHRQIMGIDLTDDDLSGVSCPIRFTFPCSPHLAAMIDGRSIEIDRVQQSTQKLLESYDVVLLEGAGGLHVPLNEDVTTIDYIAEHDLPVIMVTSPRLGSINHTILSLEACRARGVEVAMLVYNNFPPTSDLITADTRIYLRNYLKRHHPKAEFLEVDSQELGVKS